MFIQRFFQRFLTFWLVAGLLFTGTNAQALRQEPPGESSVGLEELEKALHPEPSLSAVGLEELTPGKAVPWAVSDGAIGQVSGISQGDQVVGRILIPDLERVKFISAVNPKIFELDFPRWQDPTETFDPLERNRLNRTGLALEKWREGILKQPLLNIPGARLVYLSNNVRSNLVEPWEFPVLDGQAIRPKYADAKYPIDAETLGQKEGYDDAFWTFVLDPGPPRLTALRFHDGQPPEEVTDLKMDRGRPVGEGVVPAQVNHGIVGIPLVIEGQDVSDQIRLAVNPDGTRREVRPHELATTIENRNRPAARAAIGTTWGGRLVLVFVTAHVTNKQIAELLLRSELGVRSAIRLGGSADLQQWIAGEGHPTYVGVADINSTRSGQVGRGLNAVLAGYELPKSGLEEQLEPSNLILGWEKLLPRVQNRLAKEFRAMEKELGTGTLRDLVDYVRHPVNPPDTLYQVLSDVLGQPMQDVQRTIEGLSPEGYQPPDTIPIGESKNVPVDPELVRLLLESTVFVIASGGGGDRFKKSLLDEDGKLNAAGKQLERNGRLEKPTVMIGPSGTSPEVATLEELSELARQVKAKQVYVVVGIGIDSREAVLKDLKQNGDWLRREGRLKVSVAEQDSYPSFDQKTGKILLTNRSKILRNPNGTYGPFRAAYELAREEKFANGRDWVILYGDDPILNTGEFIARLLTQARFADVAPVAIPKRSRSAPVGGTLADVVLTNGRRVHLIIEKAEREPSEGIQGLPVFNQVEDEAASKGQDPFLFNTGPLKLSAEAAAAAAAFTPRLRHADRSGIRKLELFATHIPIMVGNQPRMKFSVLQVDSGQYGAVKDFKGMARATEIVNRRSRQLLPRLPGHEHVQMDDTVHADVRPGFNGFEEGTFININGPTGAVFNSDGITLVGIHKMVPVILTEPDPADPSKEIERMVEHPVFVDFNSRGVGIPTGRDGKIHPMGFQYNTPQNPAGLEEAAQEGEIRIQIHAPISPETVWTGRLFKNPELDLQASLVGALQGRIVDLPVEAARAPAFLQEFGLNSSDLVLLDVPPGTERAWVPGDYGAPIINMPRSLAAGLTFPQLATLAEVARRQPGALLRIRDVYQPDWETLVIEIAA